MMKLGNAAITKCAVALFAHGSATAWYFQYGLSTDASYGSKSVVKSAGSRITEPQLVEFVMSPTRQIARLTNTRRHLVGDELMAIKDTK